jgi:phosphoribosyl-AMP cyclohydrolase
MSGDPTDAAPQGLVVEPTELDFTKLNGLVPFVLQHGFSREVLMVGFLNPEAWEICCTTGILTMFRRTLGRVWTMGEEDGNVPISRVMIDCDDDTVLFETTVDQGICGQGYRSCFFKELPGPADH